MTEVENKVIRKAKVSLVLLGISVFTLAVSNGWSYTILQNRINILNEDKISLQSQLNTLNNENNDLQFQMDSLNITYQDYVSTHGQSDSEYEALRSLMHLLTEDKNQLQTWLDGNKTLLQTMIEEKDQLQIWLNSNITHYESQISSLSVQIAYLEERIDNLKTVFTQRYLEEYNWVLNNLIEHIDSESNLVLTHWSAIDNSGLYPLSRLDTTIPTFTQAYKITKNPKYLALAKTGFDTAIDKMYSPSTKLFSTKWVTDNKEPLDELQVDWAAIALIGMYDFCNVLTADKGKYFTYANDFAEGLHTYGLDQTTNLPHAKIAFSTGEVISTTGYTDMLFRLVAAYIKAYEVTSNSTFKGWAKDIATAFWNRRNPTTNLMPSQINSNGAPASNYLKPNLDPIQNILTYAYNVTKDDFYLSAAINLTDSELKYGWSSSLGRMLQSIWMNGSVRQSYLDLVDGPQMFIIALLQLYHYTTNATYLDLAKTMWDTIHTHAKVNGLYVTELDTANQPNDVTRVYPNQMMVQCDIYMYYFTGEQIYFNDATNTVHNFVKFKRQFGYCNTIYAKTLAPTRPWGDYTVDWLDVATYTLGAMIYGCVLWENTSTEVDLTYYVPYYPMLRPISPTNLHIQP